MDIFELYLLEMLTVACILTVAYIVVLWHTLTGSKYSLVLV